LIIILLPAFNEALDLAELIPDIGRALESEYIILLVDDGSDDGTLPLAAGLSRLFPLRVVRHDKNRGLGAALKAGLAYASALYEPEDILITMDADNSHPPSLIPRMIDELERADMVIASRFAGGAAVSGLSLFRRLLTGFGSMILGACFPLDGVRDYTSGYRGIRVSVLKRYYLKRGFLPVTSKGFPAVGEILIRLISEGITLSEVPLKLRYDKKKGPSKLRVIPSITGYIVLLIKLFCERSMPGKLKKRSRPS